MEMVIKIEPVLLGFILVIKLFMDNAPQYRLHWMWDIPLASPLEGHCSILNSLAKTGLKNFGFVTSKNTILFLSFFPPTSPHFPFLSY